ncbi:hypothetical protein FVEG_15828 [Fusarium verticillioides 7600]|uniref:Uncharacterized protein n=1 Tax=Gibberella moniliformis (strain M3125 / FGSC 7600) TaxID=334819 RepID=W7MLG5_GIBM7|nr:hypothetical protein FVEG_15828 [Fusarium verticillioides 7600]EWG45492.1 hypothetical protein FVEG_15828 [Fusarium verticillioides 7600]
MSKLGVPTPDNPFVFDYSVSQEKTDLTTVNPAATKANLPTPDSLVPKSFQYNPSPLSSFFQGTLNYRMLTHRTKKPHYHKENVLSRMKTWAMSSSAWTLRLEYGSSLEIKHENFCPLRNVDDDLKPRLKFTIGSFTKFKIKSYRRLVNSHVGDAFEMTGRFLFTGEIKDSDYMGAFTSCARKETLLIRAD